MNILLIGPQGSGKGTQAKSLSRRLHLPHISTGDLLRELKGELKKEVDEYVHEGKLVPDILILRILKSRMRQPDCKKGFILDGFPRNIAQAQALEDICKIDEVIEIHVDDKEATKRMLSRITCEKCGTPFNLISNPPKKKGICDHCLSPLVQRKDDEKKAIKVRLATYHKETRPLLLKYDSILVDGNQPIDMVTNDILLAIKK